MTIKSILAFIFLAVGLNAQAQYQLKGTINGANNENIPYASIVLLSPSDSLFSAFNISQPDGSFSFKNLKEGFYEVVVACVGYNVDSSGIYLSSDTSIAVKMFASEMTLKEVMKKARRIPVMFNGDTMVYNAENFKTGNNADVEDLLKKLPGLTVNKDGTITTNGESITKVMVNGKEFFGGNVEAATKNIDASLVDKVELVDREKEQDELNTDGGQNREKVLNLVLKEELDQGYFGRVHTAYGPDKQYGVHANMNFFRKKTQVSIIGGMNNINERLYGWQDIAKFGAFSISPLDDWNYMTFSGGGVTTYRGIGANLNIEPGKHTKTNFSYMLGKDNGLELRESFSEVYVGENTLQSNTIDSAGNAKLNHQLNWTFEYKPDTLNTFKLRAQTSLTAQQSDRNFIQNNTREDSLLNSGINLREQSDDLGSFAAKLNWVRKNRNNKGKWYNAVYAGGSQHGNKDLAYFESAAIALRLPTEWTPAITQQLSSSEFTLSANTSYTHQVSEKIELSPGIKWLNSYYRHDFDWLTEDGLLPENSPIGEVKLQLMEYLLYLKWEIDSFSTLHFIPKMSQNLESRTFTTDKPNEFELPQWLFTPGLYFRSTKKQAYQAYFHFSTSINRPGIQQILPVINNTNPFNSLEGNIQLQNSVTYQGGGRYMRIFGLRKSVYYSNWFSAMPNPVVADRTINTENIASSRYTNYGLNSNSNHTIGLNWPINKLKCDFEWNLSFQQNQSFVLQNNEALQSRTQNYRTGVGLKFNQFEKLNLNAGYDIGLNRGRVGAISNNAFLSHNVDAEIIYTPHKRLEIQSVLNWQIFGSNGSNSLTSIPIWSGSINYTLDEAGKWMIGLQGYDFLNRNQNLWRWWSANSYSENRTNAVTRYVMFSITYKVKQAEPKGE